MNCDDTSGNKSKKWNKFDCWTLLLAGLPKHENAKLQNIHFMTCSNRVSVLDMAQPIANELRNLEKGTLRTKEQCKSQMEIIKKGASDAVKSKLRAKFGLKEVSNPLLSLSVDLYQ